MQPDWNCLASEWYINFKYVLQELVTLSDFEVTWGGCFCFWPSWVSASTCVAKVSLGQLLMWWISLLLMLVGTHALLWLKISRWSQRSLKLWCQARMGARYGCVWSKARHDMCYNVYVWPQHSHVHGSHETLTPPQAPLWSAPCQLVNVWQTLWIRMCVAIRIWHKQSVCNIIAI